MKKTNKQVRVRNGRQSFIRTVYVDDFGREFFKHDGEKNYICQKENGRYYALWYNGVEYI